MRELRQLKLVNFSHNVISEISPEFFKRLNQLAYPIVDLSNNSLTCDCKWVIQYQEEYLRRYSIQVLGNCQNGNKIHEIQQLPHYDITELVTLLGCKKCSQHLCSFRGKCELAHNSTKEYECECQAPYRGKYCQEAIPICHGATNTDHCTQCNTTYCKNGGQCIEQLSSSAYVQAFCRCRHGFDGEHCEIQLGPTNICKTRNPCMNNATCIDGSKERNDSRGGYIIGFVILSYNKSIIVRDAICQCRSGYTGAHCENEILVECNARIECNSHGKCLHSLATDKNTCYCDQGWEGKTCSNIAGSSKESTKLSASNIAVIVLALLLVLVIAILLYIIRKHRICKSRFHDDELRLNDEDEL